MCKFFCILMKPSAYSRWCARLSRLPVPVRSRSLPSTPIRPAPCRLIRSLCRNEITQHGLLLTGLVRFLMQRVLILRRAHGHPFSSVNCIPSYEHVFVCSLIWFALGSVPVWGYYEWDCHSWGTPFHLQWETCGSERCVYRAGRSRVAAVTQMGTQTYRVDPALPTLQIESETHSG